MQKTSLSREQNVEIVKQKFRDIIDYHQELNLCFVLIRDILGGLSAPGITIFIPITATVTAAFMYGETIQEAAYDMNWYEMDRTMRKEYLIFLMNLQRPFEMQSMIFVLKKPMFLAMIRSIYSCVMLLLQMNNG
ncbi:uncharacterized protein LOC123319473 [Coccinella septempunctata]|uniref:uncharacterized protein LOC123319473 n=1 Tax=Coccinella septempunctata TaxID=41139 RepID=UPI001D07D421|nr:uncharacterized protein LOC123319473 [Coccinella septempunctata]